MELLKAYGKTCIYENEDMNLIHTSDKYCDDHYHRFFHPEMMMIYDLSNAFSLDGRETIIDRPIIIITIKHHEDARIRKYENMRK